MKTTEIICATKASLAALACAIVAFSSCNKIENPSSKAVIFSVSASETPATKTVYGVDKDSKQYIDWVTGDKVRIACAQSGEGNADYTVTRTGTHKNDKDWGTISSVTPLTWGTGTHTFYAVYPSPATSGAESTLSGNTMTGIIPAAQVVDGTVTGTDAKVAKPDMKRQYLVAKATGTDANKVTPIVLDFYPMTTALEFTIQNNFESNNTMNVSSVSLSSDTYALSGGFTVNIDNAGVNNRPECTTSATHSDNGTVTITFASPIDVAYGKTLNFTFFLNPGNGGATGIDDITFHIAGTNATTGNAFSNSAKLLKSDRSGIAFPTHKKTRITGLLVREEVKWDIEGDIYVTPWATGDSQAISIE